MTTDHLAIQNLAGRFLDAYGEDLVKQLRDLKYYLSGAETVERLLTEKEDICQQISALRSSPKLKPGTTHTATQYREWVGQIESLCKKKIQPHLEAFKKLIADVQMKSAYRTRMSWEGVKSRLNHLGQLAEEIHTAVRDHVRSHYLPELGAEAARAVPSLGARPAVTAPAARPTFESLLAAEATSDEAVEPYDQALRHWESYLGKERGGEASRFTERLRQATAPLSSWTKSLFPPATGYESVLKPGYVSLEECRAAAEPLESLAGRIKTLLPLWVADGLKPLEYEGTDAEGNPRRRRILLSRLFRNLELHGVILKSIQRDVYYDVGYYLYYRPMADHFLELRLIFDKAILPRVPLRDRYQTDLKFTGLLFNDLKSRLDHIHGELRRHF